MTCTKVALFAMLFLIAAIVGEVVGSIVFLWGIELLGTYDRPLTAMWDYYGYDGAHADIVLAWWVAAAKAGLAIAVVFVGACAIGVYRRFTQPQALYGENKWASRQQAERSGIRYRRRPDPDGILLGRVWTWLGRRYLVLPGEEHVSLHAKTRAGKGVSFVIPNCLSWGGSLVCLDVKRENFIATAARRQQLGQEVYLFDPASPTGETHRWNPFSVVDRNGDTRFDQIHRIGATWFQENPQDRNPFWTDSARAAFIAVSTLVAETPTLALTPATVLRMFTRGDGGDTLNAMIARRRGQIGQQYSQAAVDGVSDWLNGHHEQVNGIRKTVATKLAMFFNPRIAAATSASDFDLRDLRRKPMSIFVGVSPGNIRRLRPLLALLFEQLVILNTDTLPSADPELKIKVLVLLDEFVRLGKVPVLAEAAAYVAGYGIRMALVLQNIAQLRGIYGADGAEDVLDNTGAEIVFGTNDLKVCKEVSERVGFDTVAGITRNRPRWLAALNPGKQSEAIHPHRRGLLLPQEIAQMPPSRQIILRAGMMPMQTDRVFWWKDRVFSRLQGEPPEIPVMHAPVAMDDGAARGDITEADLELVDDRTD